MGVMRSRYAARRWAAHGPDPYDASSHDASPRRRRTEHVRRLRAVPPALPDVSCHRRGGALASRADRCHACSRMAWRPDRRRLRRDHGDLRAVPRVRTGVPQRRPFRSPDRRARGSTSSRAGGSRHGGSGSDSLCSPRHRLLLAGSTALALAQRLRLVPKRLGCPGLPLRRGAAVEPTGEDVWLFTGCVMDAWIRDTHRATAVVLDAMGSAMRSRTGRRHAVAPCTSTPGSTSVGRARCRRDAGDARQAPIVVNSAGCGAALKDYGHLVGTDGARRFSARVLDIHEYLAGHLDRLPELRRSPTPVIVQDPCHLRHVQRAHLAVRRIVERVADVVELDDEGLCCGAGGAYSALQPELAGAIRERKLAAIARARPVPAPWWRAPTPGARCTCSGRWPSGVSRSATRSTSSPTRSCDDPLPAPR